MGKANGPKLRKRHTKSLAVIYDSKGTVNVVSLSYDLYDVYAALSSNLLSSRQRPISAPDDNKGSLHDKFWLAAYSPVR